MRVLSMRFCHVSEQASEMLNFFRALGLEEREIEEDCGGGVFPIDNGWLEVWPAAEQMPAGSMLQIVVDDADAFAEQARAQGLEPQGPVDAHGERIFFCTAPDGLPVSFQSRLD